MAAGVPTQGGGNPRFSDQYQGPDLGRWGQLWTSRKLLLFMLHTRRHAPRQPPPMWQAFGRLHLPRWDRYFIQRCLWQGGGIEVRNFSQFSAIFRNFPAIFHTSRFSDCLPTLVQNNEKFFFYYSIHSQMLHSHQNLA